MPSGLPNQPKILRGAFVEFGLSLPPLVVVFQFNPLTINRTRNASIVAPRTPTAAQRAQDLTFVQQVISSGGSSLISFRAGQTINVQQEKLTFDIRLDATDKLDSGDGLTQQFGIAPQLSTLELMMLPKSQSLLGGAVSALLGGATKNFAIVDSASHDAPTILCV